jgi:hypothetical protein
MQQTSRGKMILFLKNRWSHRKGLCFFVPPLVLTVVVGLLAQWLTPASDSAVLIGKLFKIAILGFMGLEVIAFICTLTSYFLNEVFVDEFERADKLISRLEPTEKESTFTVIAGLKDDEAKVQIESLASQLLGADMCGAEAFDRISMFLILATRLLVIFTVASIGLEFANFLSGNPRAVFGGINHSFRTLPGLLSISEQSVYATLTTLATVGFGDRAPETLAGRLLVDMEIASAILFLSFGINMLVTLVMDSSVLAWSSRREVIEVHIQRGIDQIRNVEGTTQ